MKEQFYLRYFIFFVLLVLNVLATPSSAYSYNIMRCSMVNDPQFSKLNTENAAQIIKSSGCASPSFCSFEQLFNDIAGDGNVSDLHCNVFMDKAGTCVVEYVGSLNFNIEINDSSLDFPSLLGAFQRYDEMVFVLRFVKSDAHFKCVQQIVVPFESSGALQGFFKNGVDNDFKQIREAYSRLHVAFRVGSFAFGSDRVSALHSLQVMPISSALTKFGKFVSVGGRVGVERDELFKGKLIKSYYFTNGDYIKLH